MPLIPQAPSSGDDNYINSNDAEDGVLSELEHLKRPPYILSEFRIP